MTILVTGATGNIGRHIVENLHAAGERVRVLTRDPAGAALPDGVEVVSGDLQDPRAVDAAVDGARTLYLFPVLSAVADVADAAKRAGVERIVLLTGAWAAGLTRRDRESWTYPHYRAAEETVETCGTGWTILQPGPFALNLRWWADSIRAHGVVRVPYAQAVCPLVHEADIAAVAAAALRDDAHDGRRHVLTGPVATSQVEQAEAIGRAIGRPIAVEEIGEQRWRETTGTLMRPGIADDMLRSWAETAADPAVALPVSGVVEEVTGRPALSVARWARDHAEDFR